MVKKQTIHLEEWLMISEMLHDGGAWVANLDGERCPISSATGENHKKMPVPTTEQQETLQGCVKVGALSHRRKMVQSQRKVWEVPPTNHTTPPTTLGHSHQKNKECSSI